MFSPYTVMQAPSGVHIHRKNSRSLFPIVSLGLPLPVESGGAGYIMRQNRIDITEDLNLKSIPGTRIEKSQLYSWYPLLYNMR